MQIKKRYLVIWTSNEHESPVHNVFYKFKDILDWINNNQDITEDDYNKSFEDLDFYDDYFIFETTDPDNPTLITSLTNNESMEDFLDWFDPDLKYREGASESLIIKKLSQF
jgi:hypothetical protein